MQSVSANFLAAVQGSTTPLFYADLWKSNNFIASLPLETGSCEITFDSDSEVQGSGSIVVLDNDGSLTPTSMGSDLTPFGSVVNIKAGFKLPGDVEEIISLGWFLINDMEIEEAWKSYSKEGVTNLVRKGSRITINLRDFMQKVVDYKFLVPTAPTQPTAWDEIVYLVQDVIGTQTPSYAGYADQPIPYTLTYGEDRMQAVKDLAAVLGAEPVMLPNGKLTLKPLNQVQGSGNTAPAFGWNVNVSEYKKTLSREDVYNIVVAKGKTETSNTLVGYAIKSDGPTSFYGATGPRPIFFETDLLTTGTAVKAYAEAQLSALAARQSQVVPISALPNPAIELSDYVQLTIQGSSNPITARIIGFSYRDKGEMSVNLSMPANWLG
jgi:hypothetical protein